MIAAGDGWIVGRVDDVLRDYDGVVDRWLHPAELLRLGGAPSAAKRNQSTAARLLAKRLLLASPELASAKMPIPLLGGVSPREIDIHSPRRRGLSEPPHVVVRDAPLPLRVSLSHTERFAAAAVSRGPAERIGIDVVEIASRTGDALRHWLVEEEQPLLASVALTPFHLWAAKEAAFKTLPAGTPFAPRQLRLRCEGAAGLSWRHAGRDHWQGRLRIYDGAGCIVVVARRQAAPHHAASQALQFKTAAT